ncbi:MAG: hypothetical protein GWO15_08700 [Nitrosopumilaceae archaeon]|nr:hypothetical protein [Nitrosopumilaceae archaeon]
MTGSGNQSMRVSGYSTTSYGVYPTKIESNHCLSSHTAQREILFESLSCRLQFGIIRQSK